MEKRKSGFYWVKYDGGWECAFFEETESIWMIIGAEDVFDDSDFDVVNENRIMSPDEWE